MKQKKHLAIFVTIVTLLLFTSCNAINTNNENDMTDTKQSDESIDINMYSNITIPIYDVNNQEIGNIDCFSYSALADDYILYTKLPKERTNELTEMEYHLYNIEDKNDYNLLTIKDWTYEETHEIIYKDNHLYISISTGDVRKVENSKQTIYDIDLKQQRMLPLLEVEGGFPYNSYTIAGDNLILSELLNNGDTDIITCDIHNKDNSPIVHKYDESLCFVNDSIRHIYTDQNFIYMIRLDWDDNDSTFLYIDKYDLDLNLIDTIDITNSCISTDFVDDKKHSEINNERKQFISSFF